jgi:hypothetical protein
MLLTGHTDESVAFRCGYLTALLEVDPIIVLLQNFILFYFWLLQDLQCTTKII